MPHVQSRRHARRVIALFIHEYQQRVAEAIDLLPGRPEWTRRLRLPHTGRFEVHQQARKVDSLGRVTCHKGISRLQIESELLFQVGPHGFTVSDSEKQRFLVLALEKREVSGLPDQEIDCDRWFVIHSAGTHLSADMPALPPSGVYRSVLHRGRQTLLNPPT